MVGAAWYVSPWIALGIFDRDDQTRLTLRFSQGYLPNGLVDRWWRCKGTKNTDKEPDLDYLLRSRGDLRRDYGDCLFVKTQPRR